MIDINCRRHQQKGFGVCIYSDCTHRYICKEDECMLVHLHKSYQVNLVHVKTIQQKKEELRPLLQASNAIITQCLAHLRKILELSIFAIFRETPSIRDMDLDSISINQLHQYMRTDSRDKSLIEGLQKLSSKLIADANSFKQQCLKRCQKGFANKFASQNLESSQTNEKEAQDNNPSNKRKKKKKITRVLDTEEKKVEYITTYNIGFTPEGLRNLSKSLSLIQNQQEAKYSAYSLFTFLQKNNLQVDQQLFASSEFNYSNQEFFNKAFKVENTVLLIHCLTTQRIPKRKIFGYYRRKPWQPDCKACPHSFMFEIFLDKAVVKYPFRQIYKQSLGKTGWQRPIKKEDSIMIGVCDFIISVKCNKYRSFMQAGRMFGLRENTSVNILDFELVNVINIRQKRENKQQEEQRSAQVQRQDSIQSQLRNQKYYHIDQPLNIDSNL